LVEATRLREKPTKKEKPAMNAAPKTIPSLMPPFTRETAILKIRLIEDNWNSRDPERLARGYTEDSYWRNRSEFLNGRAEIIAFLKRKWTRELDYRLMTILGSGTGHMATRIGSSTSLGL